MSDTLGDGKLELKQASKEVKESENVAEKYSAMTVSKNSEIVMGELSVSSAAFSAVPTHKTVKKVRHISYVRMCLFCYFSYLHIMSHSGCPI
jgi:hypothetical protein